MNKEQMKQIDKIIYEQSWSIRAGLQFESAGEALIDLVYLYTVNDKCATIIDNPPDLSAAFVKQLLEASANDKIGQAAVHDLANILQRVPITKLRDEAVKPLCKSSRALKKVGAEPLNLLAYLLEFLEQNIGPKSGSITTANVLNQLMAQLVTANAPQKDAYTIYDSAAGAGRSLLAVYQQFPEAKHFTLLGNEIRLTPMHQAEMLLSLLPKDKANVSLKQTDTLIAQTEANDANADIVISDPPFSSHWSASPEHLSDPRFASVGTLPPKSKADFAFVIDGLSHLKDDGTMIVQLPHGVLFRGASEGKIRQHLIDNNLVDAVIGLPAGLNYNTAIPTMLFVLRKNRSRKEILFIDASEDAEKKATTTTMSEQAVQKIVDTYKAYTDVPQYAHVATPEEVADADGNLNIPRYVDTFTPPEAIEISLLDGRIAGYQAKIAELEAQTNAIMAKYAPSND